jgi:hypothetical protein
MAGHFVRSQRVAVKNWDNAFPGQTAAAQLAWHVFALAVGCLAWFEAGGLVVPQAAFSSEEQVGHGLRLVASLGNAAWNT